MFTWVVFLIKTHHTNQVVGCDGVLNSGAVKDRCNVCNGDGSTCKRVTGTYTKDWREWGKILNQLFSISPQF